MSQRDREKMLRALALHFWQKQSPVAAIGDLEDWFDSFVETTPGLRSAFTQSDMRRLLQTELRNASLLVRRDEESFLFVHSVPIRLTHTPTRFRGAAGSGNGRDRREGDGRRFRPQRQ